MNPHQSYPSNYPGDGYGRPDGYGGAPGGGGGGPVPGSGPVAGSGPVPGGPGSMPGGGPGGAPYNDPSGAPYNGPGPGNNGAPPRKTDMSRGVMITLVAMIAVVALAITGGLIYLLARPDPKASTGMQQKWVTQVSYKKNKDNDKALTYGLNNTEANEMAIIAPNAAAWTYVWVDKRTGKPLGTQQLLEDCGNDFERPYILDNGDVVCAPRDVEPIEDVPDGIVEESEPVYMDSFQTIVAIPDHLNATAIAAYDSSGEELWRQPLDPASRVYSDGIVVITVFDDPEAGVSSFGFWTFVYPGDPDPEPWDGDVNSDLGEGDLPDPADRPGAKEERKDKPKQQRRKASRSPKGGIRNFDIANMYIPFDTDETCWPAGAGDAFKMEPMPTSPQRCWSKLNGGQGTLSFPGGAPADQQWDDFNGDGLEDTSFALSGFGIYYWFAVVANPNDANRPLVGLIASGQPGTVAYQGGGEFVVDPGSPGAYTISIR